MIVAVSAPGIVEQAIRCSRPGARILLFSQTSDKERFEVSGADICVGERCFRILQRVGRSAEGIGQPRVQRRTTVGGLISHRLPLDKIASGFDLARNPDEKSLKIIVQPQRWFVKNRDDGCRASTARSTWK